MTGPFLDLLSSPGGNMKSRRGQRGRREMEMRMGDEKERGVDILERERERGGRTQGG